MIKYISSELLHDGHGFLPQGTVIAVDEIGTIVDIFSPERAEGLKCVTYYEGIVCPGFVNAHCHMELSHLFGKVPEATGLVDFVMAIPQLRFTAPEVIQEHITKAAQEMKANGIVAVGDIANTTDAISLYPELPFHLQSFVESMGVVDASATTRFNYSLEIWKTYQQQTPTNNKQARATIVPHAPYSVSPALRDLIMEHSKQAPIVSVHNQETEAELLFLQSKTGPMTALYASLGVALDIVKFRGNTSLQHILGSAPESTKWLLVHNTFTGTSDIEWLKVNDKEVVFCLCPNANWYIERRLPNIPLLMESGFPICLGTDSLASNYSLSILSEIQRIQSVFPEISMEHLLQWSTFNGAQALGWDNIIGSFAIGKQPGIVHIGVNNELFIIA